MIKICKICGGRIYEDCLPDVHPSHAAFAAPTGLAARVVVNQDLVDEIVRRAKESEYGLDEPEAKPDITKYQPWSFETLSLCLVSSWTAKYDLVSVFSAAMSVIQEKAANEKVS